VPAWLQAWRGSHIVITTIMFNFVAAALMVYLMVNVLIAPGSMTPQSRNFEPSSFLPAMQGNALNLSLALALACCLAVWIFLWRTPCLTRNLTEDDAVMQDRRTIQRANLELEIRSSGDLSRVAPVLAARRA
jgi:hypothetical protein